MRMGFTTAGGEVALKAHEGLYGPRWRGIGADLGCGSGGNL